jgi:hypothetical protein
MDGTHPNVAFVRAALVAAACDTFEDTANLATDHYVNKMLRVKVPFVDGVDYDAFGFEASLKITRYAGWLTPPSPTEARPRMRVRLPNFLPILVRFAKSPMDTPRISLWSYNVASDRTDLPEWVQYPTRYREAIKRAGAGQLTDIMLTEAQLIALPAYVIPVMKP